MNEAIKYVVGGFTIAMLINLVSIFGQFAAEYKLWHRYEFCQANENYAYAQEECGKLKIDVITKSINNYWK